ncbi:MAG TPA: hypothetical protein VHY91_09965 [Pirellulales bacterium]|jgi:hypothetical protein|nr:hypothetical protein [Pirellulales bacterium]
MNVAFSALLTFILLVPGLLFFRVRHTLAEYEYLTPLPPRPFSVEIVGASVIAAILHAICSLAGVCLSHLFKTVPTVDLDSVMMFLLGKFGDKDAKLDEVIHSVTQHPFAIFTYFSCVFGLAIAAGKLSAKLPDRFEEACGLSPEHRIAIGEWKKFFNLGKNEDALITAVVEMAGTAYLFAGKLRRPYFNRTTFELDRLQLEETVKRPLANLPDGTEPEFEEVFGHQFMLRYSEVKTLNIVYVDQIEK